MCGICGVIALDGTLHSDVRSAVRLMNESIAHRGPDGDGFFADEIAALGHRRLAIIDRAGGHQPMSNEDGTAWITFNGEVYNHRDLRPGLEAKGHRFRTVSDTEVILHAYEEFGPSCVERLEGMFAFAIYDSRRRELFAARDRLGKKPFFYATLNGVFHFASELPALTRSPLWAGDVDVDALETYFSLGYFLAPNTVYRNVFKLLPGHWLQSVGRRADSGSRVLGCAGVRYRQPIARGARQGDRRDTAPGRPRAARKRSAAWRVPQRRHRLGIDRLVYGGGPRGSSGHGLGRLRRERAQRARSGRPHGAPLPQPPPPRSDRAAAGRGDGAVDRRARRAAGRLVGHSDLVRVTIGTPPRHGRVERRWRRRDFRRLRLPLCATRHGGLGAALDPAVAVADGRTARRTLATLARNAQGPEGGHHSRELEPRSGRCVLRRPHIPQAWRTRGPCLGSLPIAM